MMYLLSGKVLVCLYFLLTSLISVSQGTRGDLDHPSEILALIGSNTTLEFVIGETESDFTITWRSNREPLFHHSSEHRTIETKGNYESVIKSDKSVAFLNIFNISFEDAGKYECFVGFHTAGKSRDNSWILNVQGPPKIYVSPLLVEGESSRGECCVDVCYLSYRNSTEILWRIDDEILKSDKLARKNFTASVTMETLCSNATLNFNRRHHGHMVECFVRNGLNASSYAKLNVSYLAGVDVIIGSSYNPSEAIHLKVTKDAAINITCISEGYPVPNILLQKRNMENKWINASIKDYPIQKNMSFSSQTFLFKSTDENSGSFQCSAYNDIGSWAKSKEFDIKVFDEKITLEEKLPPDTSQVPVGSSGPTDTQTLLVVLIAVVIIIMLIVMKRSKESSSVNPCQRKLSNLRRRGRDDSIYTDMSQEVPDVLRNSQAAVVTENSVFYYVLESEEYEPVDSETALRRAHENVTAVDDNVSVSYAKVNSTKVKKPIKETKRQELSMSVGVEESSNYTIVNKLK